MQRSNFIKTLFGLPLVFSSLSFKKASAVEKTVFTPEMLRRHNTGLFIINVKAGVITKKNLGYAATVAWKLCYNMQYWKNSDGNGGSFPEKGMVNVFTDGWFCPIGNSTEEVCEYLNNNPHGESYRLMTKEEVLYIITNRQQGFL